jgi:hypothetical protein
MKKLNALLLALLILGISAPVFAQDEAPAEPAATEEVAAAADDEAKPEEAAPEEAPAEEAEEAAPEEAPAEEAEAPKSEVKSALGSLLVQVIEVLTVVLMLLAGWLTKKGITFVEKKTKVDIPAKYEDMLAGWAGKSVSYAAEKAHQYAVEKGEKMKGPDKLEAALGFGLSLAEEHGVTDLGKEKLVKYIESKLGESRDA